MIFFPDEDENRVLLSERDSVTLTFYFKMIIKIASSGLIVACNLRDFNLVFTVECFCVMSDSHDYCGCNYISVMLFPFIWLHTLEIAILRGPYCKYSQFQLMLIYSV